MRTKKHRTISGSLRFGAYNNLCLSVRLHTWESRTFLRSDNYLAFNEDKEKIEKRII
jgi:hypothetical protein